MGGVIGLIGGGGGAGGGFTGYYALFAPSAGAGSGVSPFIAVNPGPGAGGGGGFLGNGGYGEEDGLPGNSFENGGNGANNGPKYGYPNGYGLLVGNGGFGVGGGGGGGSIIDSSAIATLAEVSGIASPDDPYGNGEIIISAVPEPAPASLLALGLLALLARRRRPREQIWFSINTKGIQNAILSKDVRSDCGCCAGVARRCGFGSHHHRDRAGGQPWQRAGYHRLR